MSKINIIIKREYLSRVKKKSFLIMTFLTPALLIVLFALPVIIGKQNKVEKQHIAVVDETGIFGQTFRPQEQLNFLYFNGNIDTAKNYSISGNYDAVVFIPENYLTDSVKVYSSKAIPIGNLTIIKTLINSTVERMNLLKYNINPQLLQKAKADVKINTLIIEKKGKLKKSDSKLLTALGFIGAMVIYMFIFTYGAMVMKGTMEEKTGRVVEIIISSAKSFELMLGKIIGIALVAFTQFGIWLLTVIAGFLIWKHSGNYIPNEINDIMEASQSIDLVRWTILFLIYFIGGYLLYGSLFGAVGAAVDNETDTQQFMIPLTIPLIFAFIFAQTIIENPSGSIAVWTSIIPFTSPVVMMVRLGFGVPTWQILLSIGLLIATFLGAVYIAAKIYRVGLLAYGKKITYKDLWKWIKYKD